MKARISYNGITRNIGTLYPNEKLFVKVVKPQHLMRTLDAWGIDKDYFDAYLVPKNYTIELQEVGGATYRIDAHTFREHGIVRNFGHNDQIFLPRSYWQVKVEQRKQEHPLFS